MKLKTFIAIQQAILDDFNQTTILAMCDSSSYELTEDQWLQHLVEFQKIFCTEEKRQALRLRENNYKEQN